MERVLKLWGIGPPALCKDLFRKRRTRGVVNCSLYNCLLSTCSSSRMLPGRMNVNASPWIPTFAAVEDSSGCDVRPNCLIRIVSYNILAQAYVKSANFPTSPRSCLRWKNRSEAVVSTLLSLDADLLCLQELDEFHTFYREALLKEGYGSVYVQRGNHKQDGCGIFFRKSKVSLLAEGVIDYNDLVPQPLTEEKEIEGDAGDDDSGKAAQKRGDMNDVRVRLKRDCVGIIGAFRILEAPTHILIVTNTHIFWDPVLMDVKLAQVQYLAECLLAFKERAIKEFEVEPLLLVAGDFNSLPGDTVYNYVTSGVHQCGNLGKLEDSLVDESPNIEVGSLSPRLGQSNVGFTDKFPLPLVSLYAFVDKEPPATNLTHNFVGTLDYIFFVPSKHWIPKSLLALPSLDAPEVVGGLPNNRHPSDHLPIGSDFGIY